MKILRTIAEITFAIALVFVLQLYKESYQILISGEANSWVIVFVVLFPTMFLIGMAWAIHRVDKLEDKKADYKDSVIWRGIVANNNLITENNVLLNKLIKEIKRERHEHNRRRKI